MRQRTKGRVGGNPGLRAKDPAALRKVRLARQDGYMERLNETAQDWVPHVRRLRPDLAWEDVVRIINGPLPEARRWTQSRLLRAVKAYVRDGFLPETVLARVNAAKPTTACPPSSPPSRARIPALRSRRSVNGWNQCANAHHVAERDGSRRQSRCCWSGRRGWGCLSSLTTLQILHYREGLQGCGQFQAQKPFAHAKGLTMRSWPSTSRPSCMSSLHSVVHPATKALATIIAS